MNATATKVNLTTASNQWAVRPADERFWTLADLHQQTKRYAEESRVYPVALSKCKILPVGTDLRLVGPSGQEAQFQHYSFGQTANICQAPASYLRSIPASLAADNLNYGLTKVEGEQQMLFHKNSGLHLRCVTSERYERIWNYEVAQIALELEQYRGWRTPPGRPNGLPGMPTRLATEADVLRRAGHPSLCINVGDVISPAGLYASDHDCFIFQINENSPIDAGTGTPMYRGVFWSNSEVGAARFRATMFLFDSVCGNHIVWGAKVLAEVSIRHTGDARRMFAQAMRSVTAQMQRSASEDERRIQAARQYLLAPTKEDVIELAYRKCVGGLTRKDCEESYALAERYAGDHHSDPKSAWGFAAGITRLSQGAFADKRDHMDRAAGKLLELAF